MSIDAHKNFAISAIATAPTPALSGTTFSVTAADGALFPVVPFNVVVWPAGASPTSTNAEVCRVTSKGTGDNWTVTRITELSSARAIAVGDQVAATITAKTLTDVEDYALAGLIPGGRLTFTTGTPFTTSDVTGASATTLYYSALDHNSLPLYDGTNWARVTYAADLSIAVPATTSQMYDVFVYSNAGVATLELTAWTNDTTRATALVRQDGRWSKTGALTRLYLGSFRTTTVSGQGEDSDAKRHLFNAYNRKRRRLKKTDLTANWSYTTATIRQQNAAAANQVDVVVGLAEVLLDLRLTASVETVAAGSEFWLGIGEDSTSTFSSDNGSTSIATGATSAVPISHVTPYSKYPAIGRHFYSMNERGDGVNASTVSHQWANSALYGVGGIYGWIEG
jgi:hypothetical protein